MYINITGLAKKKSVEYNSDLKVAICSLEGKVKTNLVSAKRFCSLKAGNVHHLLFYRQTFFLLSK